MGDFMTYVRRTLRLILDAAFSEIVLDLKLQLPYPLAKGKARSIWTEVLRPFFVCNV